jgi:hypothetical protein
MTAWENYHLEWSPDPLSGIVVMNSNPWFEPSLNTTGWSTQNNATIAVSSAQPHERTQSLLVTPDGVTAVPQAQSDDVAIVGGQSYVFSAWLRTTSAATRVAGIFWFDIGHAFISANTVSTALVAGVWTQYGPVTYVAPSNAVYARIKTNDPGIPAAANPWWVDEATITNVTPVQPTWLDITPYALAQGGGSPISITTGSPAGMGSASQPATMSVSLDNTDHRFTFGNTTSPLWPNWKPGRRIRHYETINGRRFSEFSGFMQPPETDDWAEQGMDQAVTLTAVDRLGKAAAAPVFVSTLAEYIRYNSAATLLAYWTLGERVGPTYRPLVNTSTYPALAELQVTSTDPTASQAQNHFAAGGSPALPGDDLALPRFAPQLVGTPALAFAQTQLQAFINPNITPASNQAISVSAWVTPDPAAPDAVWEIVRIYFSWSGGAQTGLLRLRRTDSTETPGQVWKASFRDDGATFTAEAFGGPTPATPTLLTAHVNIGANTLNLYVNGISYDATVSTGTMPTSISLVQIVVGSTFMGSVGHVQIHQGVVFNGPDHNLAAHAAQYAAGLTGLAGQATGQRIVTLSRYAGAPTTDLGLIDPGTATMSKALLAGKAPLTAMREAETTEQGRLRTNGTGLVVFDPRTRRYNS